MITLLQTDEIDFLRSIRKTAIILMAMGLIDRHYPGRAVKVDEMAGILELDPRTVEKHMASLGARGRLLFNGIGYVLTDGGRALLLGSNLEADPAVEAQDLAQSPALMAGTTVQAHQDLEAGKGNGNAQNVQNPLHTMCALKEEVGGDSSLKLKDSSPPTSEDAQNVQFPTTAQILAATPVLFGDPGVVADGLGDLELIQPHYALGWVAHAYAQRRTEDNPRGLYAPAGLVYVKLRDPERPKPRVNFYVNPTAYLPEEYLEALGLVEYECDYCDATFRTQAEQESHRLEKHPHVCLECKAAFETFEAEHAHYNIKHNPDREHTPTAVNAPDDMREPCINGKSPVDIWEKVLEQLKEDMPRAAFDTWARDTAPVRYDGNVLSVGARNAYARDWLESRLTEKAQQAIVGLLETDVRVQFMVNQVERMP